MASSTSVTAIAKTFDNPIAMASHVLDSTTREAVQFNRTPSKVLVATREGCYVKIYQVDRRNGRTKTLHENGGAQDYPRPGSELQLSLPFAIQIAAYAKTDGEISTKIYPNLDELTKGFHKPGYLSLRKVSEISMSGKNLGIATRFAPSGAVVILSNKPAMLNKEHGIGPSSMEFLFEDSDNTWVIAVGGGYCNVQASGPVPENFWTEAKYRYTASEGKWSPNVETLIKIGKGELLATEADTDDEEDEDDED
jgi:hypothetical protein